MRQNKLRVYVHFVWATWDRVPFISEKVERELYRYIQGVCQKLGCDVLALNGTADHVHLLVQFPTTLTIADLIEAVKGSSSRFVNEILKPEEHFKWQGHYGAFTVSPHEKSKVIDYIKSQKQHHASGAVWKHAEESEEYIDKQPQSMSLPTT